MFLTEEDQLLSQSKQCSKSTYDLMCRCWTINKDNRPSFVDIIDELNGTLTKDHISLITPEEMLV